MRDTRTQGPGPASCDRDLSIVAATWRACHAASQQSARAPKARRVMALLMAVQGFPVNQSIAASAAVGATLIGVMLRFGTGTVTSLSPPKGGEGRGEGGGPQAQDSRHAPLIPAFSPFGGRRSTQRPMARTPSSLNLTRMGATLVVAPNSSHPATGRPQGSPPQRQCWRTPFCLT